MFNFYAANSTEGYGYSKAANQIWKLEWVLNGPPK